MVLWGDLCGWLQRWGGLQDKARLAPAPAGPREDCFPQQVALHPGTGALLVGELFFGYLWTIYSLSLFSLF